MKNFYTTILSTLITIANYAQSPHAAQLYGMTQYGSNNSKGTIFHYTPSTQTYTLDYEFKIKVKGRTPKCQIVTGNNGKYYGTTSAGGDNNAGVLFEWDSITSVYKDLHNFTGSDGKDARGGMVLYNNKLYGTTNNGGAYNFGVIYEYDITTNIYTKKVDMDSINGKNPDGSLTLLGNKFYGITHDGGIHDKGVLFEWDPATNIYTKKYDFDSINGSNPVGKLSLFNGKFYAMCNKGGAFDVGTIYQWDYAANTVTKTFDFNNTNGALPMGYLTLYNNKFYGTTYEGGIYQTTGLNQHYGVIFEYNPANNSFLKKKDLGIQAGFPGFQNSFRGPVGSLILKDNIFWSTATSDPFFGAGGIFTWNPATNQFLGKYSFAGSAICEITMPSMGTQPFESLLLSGNYLLGSTSEGAGNNFGTLYKFYPDSNQIVSLVNMEATDGAYPKGSLSKLGNKLFGLTYQGGNSHAGNIFEWDLTTQQFKERLQLDGLTTGIWPKGSLTYYSGKFYGINTYGKLTSGNNLFNQRDLGDYFSWDPFSNQYQSLRSANYARCTPVFFNNKLYTPTEVSSVPNFSAINAYNPANNTLTEKAFMDPNAGTFYNYQDQPSANGVTYYNGKFFGMTPAKGYNSPFRGAIYEWDTTTNNVVNRYDFTDSIGTYPTGDLLLVGNEFYGLTSNVGNSSNTYPCLFKWNPVTNFLQKKASINNNLYGTPVYSGGKIYFLGEGSFLNLYEYDPVLDTTITVYSEPIPLFQLGGNWNYTNCSRPPSYTQLLEVIPNKDPILSNMPNTQTVCSNENNTVAFTITDADNDTMSFQITSSNTALIPITNISITNIDSVYTINYTSLNSQTGIDTISVIANDGYGGMVNFSFVVNVNAAPSASVLPSNSTTICFGESISLTANAGIGLSYQWQVDSTNIIGATAANYFASAAGNYTVLVTNSSNCSSMSLATILIVDSLPNTGVTQNQTTLTANQNAAIYQWIDCNNNSAIVGENNQSYTAASTGDYAVAITTNNCSDTSACISVLVNTVGVKATAIDNSFTIYPNPTSGQFTILLPTENASIIVTNLMGQEIIKERATQKTTTLQLDTNGVYIVYVKTKKGTTIQKLIVNR
jgi:uncharacterized repeat protein (TIGR03803 family)